MQNTPLFSTSFCWVTLCSRIFHYWQMHRESCFSETKVTKFIVWNIFLAKCGSIALSMPDYHQPSAHLTLKTIPVLPVEPLLVRTVISSNMVSLSAWRPLFSSWWNAHTFSDKKKSGQRPLVEMSACVKFYNFTLLIWPLQAVMFIFPMFILYVYW